MLYRGRQGSSSQLSPPRLASTRVRTDEPCSATLAGWLLSWCGGRVFTKICMPPRRCLLSWPGGRTLPRRCLPNWLGWQLYGNGDGVLADVGLAVAPQVSSARVLPGHRGRPRQGSCRGSRGFPRLGSRRGSSSSGPHLILYASDLHKDLHATTEVPPEPWSQCSWWHWSPWLNGGALRWHWASCPGKVLAGAVEAAPARVLPGESTSPLAFCVSSLGVALIVLCL